MLWLRLNNKNQKIKTKTILIKTLENNKFFLQRSSQYEQLENLCAML